MSNSIQPVSSAAFSALVWDLDNNAEAIFGASPVNDGGNPPSVESEMVLGRLAGALSFIRRRVVPRVMNSLNTSELTLVHRSEANVSGDPLGKQYVITTELIYGTIAGPSHDDLETGLMSKADYRVLVPAYTLDTYMTEEDAVRIDGIDYDITRLQAHPKAPDPVAYSFIAKRVA